MHQQFIILQRCAEDLSLRCMQCHHEVHGDGLAGVAEKFAVAPAAAAAAAAAVYNSSEQLTPSGPSLRSAMRPTRAFRERFASILARRRGRLRPMAISETAAASTVVASRAFLGNPIHVRVVATHARSLARSAGPARGRACSQRRDSDRAVGRRRPHVELRKVVLRSLILSQRRPSRRRL